MRELFPDDQEAIDRTVDIAEAYFKFGWNIFLSNNDTPDADKLMEDGTVPKMNQRNIGLIQKLTGNIS